MLLFYYINNLIPRIDALKGVEDSAAHVDSLLSDQDQLERLFDLQESLADNWPQVIKPGRTFLKEGSFMKVIFSGLKKDYLSLLDAQFSVIVLKTYNLS